MRAIVFFVELLLWLLIIRILLRGLARLFGGGSRRSEPPAAVRERSGQPPLVQDLVRDRICRTYVPRSTAVVGRIDGHEELFCSEACRDKALAAVARAS